MQGALTLKPVNQSFFSSQSSRVLGFSQACQFWKDDALLHEPQHDHHGDEHFQNIQNGGCTWGTGISEYQFNLAIISTFYT